MSKVNYKQFGVTKEQRMELHLITHQLRTEILALKERDLGELKCEECGKKNEEGIGIKGTLQIHHKRYALDTNYYDLELLCRQCHYQK